MAKRRKKRDYYRAPEPAFIEYSDQIKDILEGQLEEWEGEKISEMSEKNITHMLHDFKIINECLEDDLKKIQFNIEQKRLFALASQHFGFEISYLLNYLMDYDSALYPLFAPPGYWRSDREFKNINDMKYDMDWGSKYSHLYHTIQWVHRLKTSWESLEDQQCHPEIKRIILEIIEEKEIELLKAANSR